MCRPLITKERRAQIARDAKSNHTVLTLPWMLAFGASTLRVVNEMRAESGVLSQFVRWRTAAVLPRYPDPWNTVTGSNLTADGIDVSDQSLASISNKMWVQVALAAGSTTGAVSEAYSMVRASLHTGGKLWTRRRLELQPRVNTGQTMVFPLGEPRPALDFSDFMFATVLFGLAGKISYQPAYRTFAGSTDEPDAWTALGTAQTNVTADENVNFGTMSVTPGTKMFVQPGLMVSSADDDVRGTIDVMVAGKWG